MRRHNGHAKPSRDAISPPMLRAREWLGVGFRNRGAPGRRVLYSGADNSRNERFRPTSSGFTLIEIMLVVVIIGILLAIVAPRLVGRTREAEISSAKQTLRTISEALDQYEVDQGEFPASLDALVIEPSPAPRRPWRKYLKADAVPTDPWGNPFVYVNPSTTAGRDYDLLSVGPDGQQGTEDDIDVYSLTTTGTAPKEDQ